MKIEISKIKNRSISIFEKVGLSTEDARIIWSEKYVHIFEVKGAKDLSDNYFSLLPGERRVNNYIEVDDIRFYEYTFQ